MTDHLLKNSWNLYYWPNNEWDNIQNICTVDTIENFWKWMNNLPGPNSVKGRKNFAFFRNNIRPVWEDPANIEGGKWNWCYALDQHVTDKHWMECMLFLIGENLPYAAEIVGITVQTRPSGDRMSLWTRSSDSNVMITIGLKIKLKLNLRGLTFKRHKDSVEINSCYQTKATINL